MELLFTVNMEIAFSGPFPAYHTLIKGCLLHRFDYFRVIFFDFRGWVRPLTFPDSTADIPWCESFEHLRILEGVLTENCKNDP